MAAGAAVFLSVTALERRKLRFDEAFPPGILSFSDPSWQQKGDLWVTGSAELLDRNDTRTIRVRGHIRGPMQCTCARCLEPAAAEIDNDFDLYYYPMALIARNEVVPIQRDDTDMGFYEGDGMELGDVVREQVVLWQPMRALCQEDCLGLCPHCGANRNYETCGCADVSQDSRWGALRHLREKHKM